jgi:phosphoglycolate phosphatase
MTKKPAPRASRNDFAWMDSDAYLFDIDGTLLVARGPVHYNAMNRAIAEVYGEGATIDGVAYHGKTDLGILRAALERAGVSGLVFQAKLWLAIDLISRDVQSHVAGIRPEVCRGIPDVLGWLKARDKLLGIASGNLEAVGWCKVRAAGLDRFFKFGCFSDHHERRADIFERGVAEVRGRLGTRASVCFVGDTPEDIKAARQVNAKIIAVSTGVFSAEELIRLDPDVCVASCRDLLNLAADSASEFPSPEEKTGLKPT